jgi:ABC-type multidrug transport system fused ATPase/permease subunit
MLFLFTPRERRQMYWLLATIIISALIEVVGIASIMPFMGIVTNPDLIQSNKYLHWLYVVMEFQSANRFLFFTGTVFLAILIISNFLSALTAWFILRFIYDRGHSLSERLLSKYLSQPYAFFLNRNSAELTKNIITEVSRFVGGALLPGIQIVAKCTVVLFIMTLLCIMDPWLALIVIIVLGGAYTITFSLIRRNMTKTGNASSEAHALRYKAVIEALSAIKDIKLVGNESEFIRRYSVPTKHVSKYEAMSQTAAQLPRYALESIAFGGILLILLYLLGIKKDISHIVPLLAVYAFAGYRLMPGLQQIFSSLSLIRFNASSLDILYKDFSTPIEPASLAYKNPETRMAFKKRIELHGIRYAYPGSNDDVVHDLDLAIDANTTIALVGSTGSGKTTIVDIVLGLLQPGKGTILVDETEIDAKNMRDWQHNLGYVPQQIYLSDDTISANIAFGVPEQNIDPLAVERAAKIANLHDFVMEELPAGYSTLVGERGVRLSGGQRQRIGIARALYHSPKVLVLDEATSALDGITENAIIDAIHNLSHQITIIMIAHRLTTVRECDIIYLLDHGRVVARGTYQELLEKNVHFQEMANLSA